MVKQAIQSRGITLWGSEQLLANLAMVAAVLFWGISYVSIKVTVSEIPPITMALIRFIIASFLLVILLKKYEPNSRIDKKDIPRMFMGGLLGITLYFYLENTGVKFTTAANASLIVTIIPVIAISLDIIFFRSKITILKLVGVTIALIGTYLSVTANGKVEMNSANFIGNLFIVGAMLSWAFYTLINKSLQDKYSGMFLTTYQTVFGTLCLIPLSLIEYKQWSLFSLTACWNILFLAICCSVGCYLFYMYTLKNLDVTITTLYLNLVPVVGVVCGYVILNERVLPIQLVGGILTLLAIGLVNFNHYTQGRKANSNIK